MKHLVDGPRGRRLLWQLVEQRIDPRASWRWTPDQARAAITHAVQGLPADTSWTSEEVHQAFAESVGWARYWQEPDEVDLALAGAVDLLRPVAERLREPAWWADPLARDEQIIVTWDPPTADLTGSAPRLVAWRAAALAYEARARAERPRRLDAPLSSSWWSTPAMSRLPSTSREVAGLSLVEDDLGWDSAEVQPVTVAGDARVFEVDGPEDWVRLVDDYPLDVSASRRHDWHRAVGAVAPLLVPDYLAASRDWDGVHVSARGYLHTATRALATAAGHTVLAGWHPDQTCWLTDCLRPAGDRRTVRVDQFT